MKKCINCHQKAEKLNDKGLCEDCFDAMFPELDFKVTYDYKAGNVNSLRMVSK
jgi:hypothetical protein